MSNWIDELEAARDRWDGYGGFLDDADLDCLLAAARLAEAIETWDREDRGQYGGPVMWHDNVQPRLAVYREACAK